MSDTERLKDPKRIIKPGQVDHNIVEALETGGLSIEDKLLRRSSESNPLLRLPNLHPGQLAQKVIDERRNLDKTGPQAPRVKEDISDLDRRSRDLRSQKPEGERRQKI